MKPRKSDNPPGSLYLVATPIGNLGDITLRALDILRNADFIAAEDTRVTRKLLTHFDIGSVKLYSYRAHNRAECGGVLLSLLLSGQSGALVTDAGSPVVSDPGADLVALCREAGVTVSVVPGACAAVAALTLSGLPSGRFCFEGFLSHTKKQRKAHLQSLPGETRAMVFYEAPHKLLETLADFCAVFGPERRVVVCRELTKIHEEALDFTVGEALEHFTEHTPRGEFTLVVAGLPAQKAQPDIAGAQSAARELLRGGCSVRDAARSAAKQAGVPRREIYEKLIHKG
ncbi:MAG: 16S rRNA (cytidine(1402)-2'-O)-methyltransferase [Oscillospiraceae bacterium]|nr:16S rRNA (cytidine(1402)-2'-O)-methyltransferase [Oscillospiraceae bacterium]